MNLAPCIGKSAPSRLQKSGVSVVKEKVPSIVATQPSLPVFPIMNAAPPALAVYSNASPGFPWAVSDPTASPYFISSDATRPMHIWIPAVPALQANSRSAQVITGTAPRACPMVTPLGFTA